VASINDLFNLLPGDENTKLRSILPLLGTLLWIGRTTIVFLLIARPRSTSPEAVAFLIFSYLFMVTLLSMEFRRRIYYSEAKKFPFWKRGVFIFENPVFLMGSA
jgi:hypothetical protein